MENGPVAIARGFGNGGFAFRFNDSYDAASRNCGL